MNLKQLCKEKGTNINKLAEKVGVTPSTLYAISNGDTTLNNVGVSLFIAISSELGYTTDELYALLSGAPESPQLTDTEQEIVDIMRSITPQGQQQLLLFARGVSSTFAKNNQVCGIEETA